MPKPPVLHCNGSSSDTSTRKTPKSDGKLTEKWWKKGFEGNPEEGDRGKGNARRRSENAGKGEMETLKNNLKNDLMRMKYKDKLHQVETLLQ